MIESLPLTISSSPARPTTTIVHRIEDLVAFFEPHVDLAIFTRELSPTLSAYVATIARGPHFGWTERVNADGTGLDVLARALPDGNGRDELVDDVRLLVDLMAEVTGAEHVGVRLARIIAPMCPRFHVDPVFVRLLSTYAGAGAQWLDERDVERSFLGHAAGGKRDEESGLIRPEAKVWHMNPGDVGLFKGKGYPGNEKRGAVHRSPPETSAEAPRLLLTLDPLD